MAKLLRILIALLGLTTSIQAASIALSGRIQGRLNDDFNNVYTLHLYWFTVTAPTTINYTFCVTNGPGGNWNSGLVSHVLPNAGEFADLDLSIGTVVGANGSCLRCPFR